MKTDIDRHVGASLGEASAEQLVRVALALEGWDAAARDAAAARLGELCACRVNVTLGAPRRWPATPGSSREGVVVTLAARETGAPCAWLELEAPLARGLVDVAVGGTLDTAELGHVEPLDTTRTGILLYLVASTLAALRQDALRVLDVRPAAEVPRPARLACAARVSLQGRSHGALLSVDPGALPPPALTPSRLLEHAPRLPTWARALRCELRVELACGALDHASLASLEPGDVLVPDRVWAEAGAWERAALCCDAFDGALAMLRLDGHAALRVEPHALGAERSPAPRPGDSVRFSVDAARVQVSLAELATWLREGRIPLSLDPHAPLTLWVDGGALARGRLVRERSEVGLCVESVRAPAAATRPY